MVKAWTSKFGKPLLFVLILSVLLGCIPEDNSPTGQISAIVSVDTMMTPGIKIGFCPTMTGAIQDLHKQGIDFRETAYTSSGTAFSALNNGLVDAIIIGRSANSSELSADLRFVRLQDGFTLISNQPGLILFDDLVKIIVHTSENESIVQEILPPSTHINYYEDIGEALSMIYCGAVLLHWSQVQPDDKLLIPIDSSGNKIQTFRSPHLYYKDKNLSFLTELIENFTP